MDAQIIELPYEDKELSMIIVLPKQKDGLNRLEKNFTALANLISGFKAGEKKLAKVAIPKFKMTLDMSLKKADGGLRSSRHIQCKRGSKWD